MTQTQEFAILILGSFVMAIALFTEKRMKKSIEEKILMQVTASRMARDLQNSYSYIGEINRKLDILENIALGYPESSKLSQRNEDELYASIMSAVGLFGKSEKFALRFICLPDWTLIKELNSVPENPLEFFLKGRTVEVNYFESDEFFVITSPKTIDNILAYIVIRKKHSSQKLEDVEIMKTLVSQALFIFMFMRHKNKRQIKCVI